MHLIITVGIPGSGKSFEAKKWVAGDPGHRMRVNRDMLREMGHGRWLGTYRQEEMVTLVQREGTRALLRAGVDVVIDDTNLRPEFRQQFYDLAVELGASFDVWDLTGVPLQLCLDRNDEREGAARLKPDIITGMHKKWIVPLQGCGVLQHEPWLVTR